MPHIKRREIKKTKIEIIPMIDTMFFLLVFFILASLNVLDLRGVQVRLPDSVNQDKQAIAPLAISIKPDGQMLVNKTEKVDNEDELGAVLLQQLQGKVDGNGFALKPESAIVVINADRKVPYHQVRGCIDAARRVRFRKFSIATNPKIIGAAK